MGKNKNNPNIKTLPNIGAYVVSRLKELGLNKAKLSKRTGWSKSTITNLLKKNNWNVNELQEVGKALGENLHQQYIEAPEEPMVPASEVEELLKEKVDKEATIEKLKIEKLVMEAKYEGTLAAKKK